MKRFDFPLERVRRWRGTEVELEHAKLEKLFAERRRLDEQLHDLAGQVAAAQESVRESAVSGNSVDARLLIELEDFRLYAKREQARIGRIKAQLLHHVAEQQEKLIEARRRRRLLDRLRERAVATWEAAHQKELEETASELFLAKRVREDRARPKPQPAGGAFRPRLDEGATCAANQQPAPAPVTHRPPSSTRHR